MVDPVLDDADYCLPPLKSKVSKVDKPAGAGSGRRFCMSEEDMRLELPKPEFPNDFQVGMTASEEDDFFAELAQRLALSEFKNVSSLNLLRPLQVRGGSPQSILGGIGSCSGRSSNGSTQQEPSPPATPYEAEMDPWGTIFDARLKPSVEDPFHASSNEPIRAALNSKPESNHHMAHFQNVEARFYAEQKGMKHNYLAAARKGMTTGFLYERHLQELKRSACGVNSEKPNQPIRRQSVPVQPSFQGVQLQRKKSAGTGVFIPRRYHTTPDPPKQNTVTSPALVPAKVIYALNKSFEEISARSQLHCSPYAASLNQQTYDALLDRRRDVLAQQRRGMAKTDDATQTSLEACLPQEWSY